MSSQIELPDKLYFKIGEVTELVGVKQHVLRYWESEFPTIKPQKSKTNQRLYRRKDVEAVITIKHLLYDRKFTIEGARQHLKSKGSEQLKLAVDSSAVENARKEAAENARLEVLRAQNSTRDHFEKELLSIKSELLDFAARIKPSD